MVLQSHESFKRLKNLNQNNCSCIYLKNIHILGIRRLILCRNMSTAIKDVDIDPQGVFKYILIQVSSPDESGKFQNKMIVRGYSECPYHADIDDKVTQELQGLKASGKIKEWKSKVLGGGRIKHDPEKKVIEVYGYSQGFGKADHEKTVGILKSSFAGYNITWSDEGY